MLERFSHSTRCATGRFAALFVVLIAPACSDSQAGSDPDTVGGTGSGATAPVAGGGGTGSTGGAGGQNAFGGASSPVGMGGVGAATTGSNPGADDALGRVSVVLNAAKGFTSMLATVYDKPVPQERIWTVSQTVGECQLLKPKAPFCDPACTVPQVCGAANTCESPSVGKNAGTLTVDGVLAGGTSQLSFEPSVSAVDPTLATYNLAADFAYPPFAAGDAVSVKSSGGAYAPFSLQTKAIAPIVTTLTSVPITKDQPSVLTWEAGTVTDALIHVEVDISHHGGLKGKIVCDASDDGSLEIPATLTSALIALGVAGFPTVNLARQIRSSTRLTEGRVELFINSALELAATVPGVTSCNAAKDCPSGTTCTASLVCL